MSGNRTRLETQPLIERAADQQDGDEHNGCVEISMLGVMDGFDQRHRQREYHANADRDIHIDAAGAQRPKSRAEERLAGIGRGGNAINADSQ